MVLSGSLSLLELPAEDRGKFCVTGMHSARGIAGIATMVSPEDPRIPSSFPRMA
jgi:hypothetical protein